MIVSREDAVGLLSKWATEGNPIWGVLMADGIMISFGGFITTLQPDALVVTHRIFGSDIPVVDLTIGLEMVDEFSYGDAQHEMPRLMKKVVSCLTIQCKGTTCLIAELATD